MDALSYARASQDRTGEELSVARQHEDHRALADSRQATITRELTDNDVSAAGKRKRPDFEVGLELVRKGEARVIIATDMSRLTRGKARDEVRLLELGLETGLQLWFVRAPDLDLSTAAGRLTASILIAAARHEIEQKSERQRRAARQAAEQGRRIGGRRPFGYEADGVTIREAEAQAIRDAYDAVLTGVPIGRIAATWNGRGLTTPQTKRDGSPSPWTAQTVRPVLLNPRYAGLRSHVTEQLRESMDPRKARIKGIVGKAAWKGLVGEETWRAVVEVLTNPSRLTGPRSGKGLLTGVGLCGICEATVHRGAAPARRGQPGHTTYRCRASYGHVGRASEPVDLYVTELVIARLERPDAAALLIDHDRPNARELDRETRAIRARLDALARLLADEVLDEISVRRESKRLRERLAEVEAEMADAGRLDVLGPLVRAGDVRAAVLALDTDRLRLVINLLMTVKLLPPGRGTRTFRPESVVVEWR
ncbi:recombinase family protein [Micromonospora zamorensis]|uniref:recombinase family protein n=1 Tax=Micromonospora zamorensis TaxID=709883 RepID=UPI00081FA1E9|nr:recombinase family protein [Micromonospora zamorensis]SCG38134.1 Site-specific DNA recombinase [Micromonospora zamorensis]